MKFNYGDTLRIRSDLYTILGKIRYINTHGNIWYEYKLVKHSNNKAFWLRWDKKRDAYHFSKLCGKAPLADMKLVDSGYEMVTGTWGEIDEGITDTAKCKEYVSVEQDVEITDTIKDRMDTVKIMRFVGPIVWILANVLIFMPRFDINILNGMHDFLTWPYIVGGNIIIGIIVAFVLFKR